MDFKIAATEDDLHHTKTRNFLKRELNICSYKLHMPMDINGWTCKIGFGLQYIYKTRLEIVYTSLNKWYFPISAKCCFLDLATGKTFGIRFGYPYELYQVPNYGIFVIVCRAVSK